MHYIRKSLIYSTRKVFLEKAVIELVYKLTRSSTAMFEKVSRSLKYDSFVHKHIYLIYICGPLYPRLCCVCGVMSSTV